MFTGIVEELAEVVEVVEKESAVWLTLHGSVAIEGLQPGGSLAVNGVCLTVVETHGGRVTMDVIPETLARTTLSELRSGGRVNLERPLAMGARLDGHLVQGHVEAVGEVLEHRSEGAWEVLRVSLPEELAPFVVEKGSIALDGVSLTLSGVAPGWVEVSLIPTTLRMTTLGRAEVGSRLNIETDMIARHLAVQVTAYLEGRLPGALLAGTATSLDLVQPLVLSEGELS
jgi:riboflavin synthase